jgi:LytS/YehU family sensor histidine kinase
MNPHFMFNSLNSIKYFILQSKPETAAEYLSDFAHLIRMILQHSRKSNITLSEELEVLELYIELEQLRFGEAFEFSKIIDPSVELEFVKIPPMLLQPYVENAIWHGLNHSKSKGSLILEIRKTDDFILCIIDDNGIGRTKSASLKSLNATKYKSMGMGITQNRIDLINKLNQMGIAVEIIDKKDQDGSALGTKVVLKIPHNQE